MDGPGFDVTPANNLFHIPKLKPNEYIEENIKQSAKKKWK